MGSYLSGPSKPSDTKESPKDGTVRHRPSIYLTYFGTFCLSRDVNASETVAKYIDKKALEEALGVNVEVDKLWCDFERVADYLPEKLRDLKPKVRFSTFQYS